MLKLAARGALAGALGGAAAGAVDFLSALPQVGGFLPSGRPRLALFLCAEYGAAAGLVVALLCAGALLIGRATDLGGLLSLAARGGGPAPGPRIVASPLGLPF